MDKYRNYSFKKLLDDLINFSEIKFILMEKMLIENGNLLLENIFIITIGIYAYIKGIKCLAMNNNVAAGNVLLRSIFEGLINIKYITQDESQLRAVSFELNDFKKQKKFVQDIIENYDNLKSFVEKTELSDISSCKIKLEEIDDRRKEYLDIYEKNFAIKIEDNDQIQWEEKIWKKAPSVGLFSEYKSIYPYLCSFAHLDATGLKTFFQLGDKTYDINIEKGKDDVESLLGITCAFYLKTLNEVLKKFNLFTEEEFKPFEKTFKVLNSNS